REGLDEIAEMTADIAEMDIEDFFPRTEIVDDIVDFAIRILQHFGNGALAEIEAMVRIFVHGDEFFQAIHAAENGVDAAVALRLRHPGIMRVAGHPYLVFRSHRHHAGEEIVDALPVGVRAQRADFGQLVFVWSLFVIPGAVGCRAAPRSAPDALYSQDAHVVLHRRDANLRAVFDHLLQSLNVAVTLRT